MRTTADMIKMNGLGNKIIVADMRARHDHIQPAAAIALAGGKDTAFDQIMAVYDTTNSDYDNYIEIWNSDGSKAQACGNGTRCVVEWLFSQTGKTTFVFETDGGIVQAVRLHDGLVAVDMGVPRLDASDIPTSRPLADTNHVDLSCGPLKDANLVSMGNPHAIFFVDEDVWGYALEDYGPKLEHDALFPERANISIAHITSSTSLDLRTWERGAGLTLACGTGACASVVAACRRGLTGNSVTVTLPGGTLEIEWRKDGHIIMTGSTEYEFSGHFDPENGSFERI